MNIRYYLFLMLVFIVGCDNVGSNRAGILDTPTVKSCAAVNGKFIAQHELDDLVLRAYGRKVMDDMVLLEVVLQYAADKGIVLTDEMYADEFKRFLSEIAPDKPESDQRAIFAFVLKKRGLTPELFDLILKKQAILRACIEVPAEVSEEELQDEYIRLYGQKRSVMLLSVSSARSIERAETELSLGKSFDNVVLEYSEDETSLRNGGFVSAFSLKDTHLPEALRNQAFNLSNSGDISESFQVVDNGRQYWYKIRLEKIIPKVDIPFERTELSEIVIRKKSNQQILDLQEKLLQESKVIIIDGRLKNYQ